MAWMIQTYLFICTTENIVQYASLLGEDITVCFKIQSCVKQLHKSYILQTVFLLSGKVFDNFLLSLGCKIT